MTRVGSAGDVRSIVANSLLAVVRGEMSTSELEALAKGAVAIAALMNAEAKMLVLQEMLRSKGAEIGKIQPIGRMAIDAVDDQRPAH